MSGPRGSAICIRAQPRSEGNPRVKERLRQIPKPENEAKVTVKQTKDLFEYIRENKEIEIALRLRAGALRPWGIEND